MASEHQSPVSRKERDTHIRQTDILNAAEKLFAAKGFHNVCMEQVAEMAGYATGTLYRYFKNKEDLYNELLRRKLEGYLQQMRAASAKESSATAKLHALLTCKAHFFQSNAPFLTLYIYELETKPRPSLGLCVPEKCAKPYDEIINLMKLVISEGIASGEFVSVNPDFAVSAITGLSNQVLLDVFRSGANPADAAVFIHRFVESALLLQRHPVTNRTRKMSLSKHGQETL